MWKDLDITVHCQRIQVKGPAAVGCDQMVETKGLFGPILLGSEFWAVSRTWCLGLGGVRHAHVVGEDLWLKHPRHKTRRCQQGRVGT